MVRTFYLKHVSVADVSKRVSSLGIFDYNMNWSIDVDEKLNAITFNVRYTPGGDTRLVEEKVLNDIDTFIKGIDLLEPPK